MDGILSKKQKYFYESINAQLVLGDTFKIDVRASKILSPQLSVEAAERIRISPFWFTTKV